MPPSTLQDASSPAGPDLLTENGEPTAGVKTSRVGVVLSSQAKERLKLLNRVLANCAPKSIDDRDSVASQDQLQQG